MHPHTHTVRDHSVIDPGAPGVWVVRCIDYRYQCQESLNINPGPATKSTFNKTIRALIWSAKKIPSCLKSNAQLDHPVFRTGLGSFFLTTRPRKDALRNMRWIYLAALAMINVETTVDAVVSHV